MTHRDSRTSLYGPMPAVGTLKVCDFCHMVVTLKRAPSGWHYWCADMEPVDGQRRCDGGTGPGTREMPPVWTLHVPAPVYDGVTDEVTERWFHRYAPDGAGRFA